MGIPNGMTMFDAFGNFNILRAVRMGGGFQIQQGKAYPTTVNLKSYSHRYIGNNAMDLPLDSMPINAESPDVLFSLMRTCVSYDLGDLTESEVHSLLLSKHNFFSSTREQSGITMLQNVSVQTSYRGDYLTVTPAMVTGAFNPGALAILSLPAYLVLDISTFATAASARQMYGRLGIYENLAPARNPGEARSTHIDTLDDYMDAFHYGNFIWNNSDIWLSIYGLAYCIAAFVQFVMGARLHETMNSMNELFSYVPFNWAYSELVRLGALHDPFDRSKAYWSICEDGIENAREANEDLLNALKLAELLQPFPITPVAPGSVKQIFYGLIDIFPLRNYFGISPDIRFKYPK